MFQAAPSRTARTNGCTESGPVPPFHGNDTVSIFSFAPVQSITLNEGQRRAAFCVSPCDQR